jgi:hypothetical protein
LAYFTVHWQYAKEGGIGVFARPRGNLEDNRAPGLHASLNDRLKLLHVVEIIGGQGIAAGYGLGEKIDGVRKP